MAGAYNAQIDFLQKTVKLLNKQLLLAKRTVVAFGVAYEAQRHGHSNKWDKAVALYQKCEDELNLDDVEGV